MTAKTGSFSSVSGRNLFSTLCLLLAVASGGLQAASPLNLAQQPLYGASSAAVYPNLMFILDSSGSMGWDHVPDYVNDNGTCFDTKDNATITESREACAVGHPPYMSPDFNLLYYNPDFTYQPGWNGTLTTPAAFSAQSISNAGTDPYGQQRTTQTGASVTSINLTTTYPDRKWCQTGSLDISNAGCIPNTQGYAYPDSSYGYPPASGGSYVYGAPYYWRIIPTEYCRDTAKTACVDWRQADAVVSGESYTTSKYCADLQRTYGGCQDAEDNSHRYPSKCSASACVQPGQGGVYIHPASVRFCTASNTSSALVNCQGLYNSVTSYIYPKFVGYVIPAAGAKAFGTITIESATPGQQIAKILISGDAVTNLLTGVYTVPSGATTTTIAQGLKALMSTTYKLQPNNSGISLSQSGNAITITSAVTGVVDNGHVITINDGGGLTSGTKATATITVGSNTAGTQTYRLGGVCVGSLSGSAPTQVCNGSMISNSVDVSADLNLANGRAAVATAIAGAIANAAVAGYTAVANGSVVTITAPNVGVFTNPVVYPTPTLTSSFATGSLAVFGAQTGTLPYSIGSIKVGATTINTSAISGNWDLTTSGGQNAAASAIAAKIGSGYTAVASGGLVTITATTAGNQSNGALTVQGGTNAAGSIKVMPEAVVGTRNYTLTSILVGSTTIAANVSFSADLSTSAGRNSAATAIKSAIGNGYIGSCTGGAACTTDTVTVTATTPGAAAHGNIQVNSAAMTSNSSAMTLTITETVSGWVDVSAINMTGGGCSSVWNTGTGILNGDPSSQSSASNAASQINSKLLKPGVPLTMTRAGTVLTFTPTANLAGCTLSVVKTNTGTWTFVFSPSATFAAGASYTLPAPQLTAVSGGMEVPGITPSGMSGGDSISDLQSVLTTTIFAGGVDSAQSIPVSTADFRGGADAGGERRADVGSFKRCDITSTADCVGLGAGKFPRASTRTDCANAGYCSYTEEATNFANWYAFNRTRMQAMKTGAGLAFSGIGSTYRVGFTTIQTNSTTASDFLKVSDFDSTQKKSWYTKFYAKIPNSGTPLRTALARVGQMFAHKGDLAAADPMQYSCQQNFSLLTTDGYWNSNACTSIKQVDNVTTLGQQDGAPTVSETNIAAEMWDGDQGGVCLDDNNGPSSVGTLADVAYYYAHTDLRDSTLSNCSNGVLGTAQDVCKNNVPHINSSEPVFQHMSTYTLGLGVSGTLSYQFDYDTAKNGDYYDIKHKTKKWPTVMHDAQTTVDDLWHAAVNGFGKYFSASNPTILKKSLDDALSTIKSSVGSGAAAATSAQALTTQTQNFAYVASYQSVYWYGNLEARKIDAKTAEVSPGADWCITDITPDLSTGATACTGKLKTQVHETTDDRTIYLFAASGANRLRNFSYADLTTTEQTYFQPCTPTAPITALSQCGLLSAPTLAATTPAALVNYLRGQYGQEMNSSTNVHQSFRGRSHPFGDAVGSQPVFVGLPSGLYVDVGYADYKSKMTNSPASGYTSATDYTFPTTVYIGANDGMLHAFNATDGVERWAYIPTTMLPKLRFLADESYSQPNQHKYFVNASPVVADVCFDPCVDKDSWRTILVGGYGAGGKGYYALDITDPAQPKGLWEFGEGGTTTDDDMGYSFGNPIITKRPDGKWVVLLTSGYENTAGSGTGKGVLFVVNPETGSRYAKITNNSGSKTSPSGLGKIEAFITNAVTNNTTRDVYGGDMDGNVWRFRLDVGAESVVKIAQLASAIGDVQPITTKPILTTLDDSAQTRYVIVGTGSLLQTSDMTDSKQHAIYAFAENYDVTCATDAATVDRCDQAPRGGITPATAYSNSTVVPSTMATVGHCAGATASSPPLPSLCSHGAREQLVGTTMVANGVDSKGRALRASSSTTVAAPKTPVVTGCYADFPDTGERVTVDPLIESGKVTVVTNVPESTACSTGGHSFQNVFNYKTCKAELSVELGDALAVGLTVVQTADGKKIPLVTMANNPTPETGLAVPQTSGAFQGRRVGWRLITD